MPLYLKPFYNILRQQTNFDWTVEHQKRFEEKKLSSQSKHRTLSQMQINQFMLCAILRILELAQPYYNHRKLQKKSYLSKLNLFTQAELRLAKLMRGYAAIIYLLTDYEFLILGSKHPIVLLTDHKPITFLFSQKSKPNHEIYRFQVVSKKFSNLHVVWTTEKNLHCQIHLAETRNQNQ